MVKLAPDWPSTQWLMRNRRRLLRGISQPETAEFTVTRRQPKPRKASNKERLLRMRIRLFNADPHCFWCGVKVQLTGGNLSTFATVDHLYSRWHPERKARHVEGKSVLHVLACHDCNQERAGAEVQMVPFVPKLKERLEFAQRADATLAKGRSIPVVPVRSNHAKIQVLKEETRETRRVSPMRVIQTLEEAVEYARENPAR